MLITYLSSCGTGPNAQFATICHFKGLHHYMSYQSNYPNNIFFRKQNWTKETARTCPRMCALECQKVSRPSSLSNVNNLSSQSPSRGLDMSHKIPFTREINALEAKPFDISLAISRGVVAHFFPSFTVPSGKVILDRRYIKHQPTIPKKNKKHIYV